MRKFPFPNFDVVLVPLSQLQPLSGLYNLSNRTPDEGKILEILREWRPAACDPMILWQETPESRTHILAGHHRYEVFTRQAQASGISPDTFMVRATLLTPKDAKAEGMSHVAFVEDVVRKNNFQNPEGTSDHLQMFQTQSPWVTEFEKYGLTLEYKGTKRTTLNYSAVLRAFIASIKMFRAFNDELDITDIMKIPLTATDDELDAVFRGRDWPASLAGSGPDPKGVTRHVLNHMRTQAVEALANWEMHVASPLHRSPAKISPRLADELLFVLLVALDNDNVGVTPEPLLKDMAARFTRPTRPYMAYRPQPNHKRDVREVLNHMLGHMNHKRPDSNKVRILNRRHV